MLEVFESAGFSVLACRPFHWLPRNVWARWPGLPMPSGVFEAADATLVHLPGLRRLATAWALVARRPA